MSRTSGKDNKESTYIIQGARARDSNNLIASITFQNYDDDSKINMSMAKIGVIDTYGNSNIDGVGDIVFLTKTNNSNLSEVLRMKNSGRIGLGTSNPTERLQVFGNTSVRGISCGYLFHDLVGSQVGGVTMDNATDVLVKAGTGDIILQTGGDTLRLTNSGMIGIGTSNPTDKVHVVGGSVRVQGSGSNGYWLSSATGTNVGGLATNGSSNIVYTATLDHVFVTGSNESARILHTNGFIGVGLSNPTERLHISGNVAVRGSGNGVILSHVASGCQVGTFFMSGTTNAAVSAPVGDLVFVTGSNEAGRIARSGYFGVGTSNPTERLHVTGGNMLVQGAPSNGLWFQDTVGSQVGGLVISGSGIDLIGWIGNPTAYSNQPWVPQLVSPASNIAVLSATSVSCQRMGKRVDLTYNLSATLVTSTSNLVVSLPSGLSNLAISVTASQIYSKALGSNLITAPFPRTITTSGTSVGELVATSNLSFRLARFLPGTWTFSGSVSYDVS